ncbi:MAG: radical SAM protein [Candidatus Cloacimonetes bacterium]|nr:radical SAM protein [Candidatus Cloacimonadota bacterium]
MKIFPVFIPHQGCPHQCIYCNQHAITGSRELNLRETGNMIADFCKRNQAFDKQIAFFGGTFTNLPADQQYRLLQLTSKYLDDRTSVRISTRPDAVNKDILTSCQSRGVRTIELGIQSFSDKVLSSSQRGYNKDTAVKACSLVQDYGFELCIQLLPGLPGFNRESLRETEEAVLSLMPLYVRIYPLIVLKSTPLEILYKAGKYHPLTVEDAIKICSEMTDVFSENNIKVIKTGLHSNIAREDIVAGPYRENFGELVKAWLLIKKIAASYQPRQTLVIPETDISLWRGSNGCMLKKLKQKLGILNLAISTKKDMKTGQFYFSDITPQKVW